MLFRGPVKAGFPSPADDHLEKKLDLNDYLVKHPAATFFVRVAGDSMKGIGITQGDILVVDRALEAKNGSIILAVLDNEFTVKRFVKNRDSVYLHAENKDFEDIVITKDTDFSIWGVITFVIKDL